jgi:hypothetical protein
LRNASRALLWASLSAACKFKLKKTKEPNVAQIIRRAFEICISAYYPKTFLDAIAFGQIWECFLMNGNAKLQVRARKNFIAQTATTEIVMAMIKVCRQSWRTRRQAVALVEF